MPGSDAPGESVRRCRDCGELKPVAAYPEDFVGRGGPGRTCSTCHDTHRRGFRERLAGAGPSHRRHGVGQVEFDELLEAQGGRCAICGRADPEHVDRDHRTGWVRGILCFNCSSGLGRFRDSPEALAEAITYLKGTTWQRVLIHPGVFQMCSPMRGRPPSRSS